MFFPKYGQNMEEVRAGHETESNNLEEVAKSFPKSISRFFLWDKPSTQKNSYEREMPFYPFVSKKPNQQLVKPFPEGWAAEWLMLVTKL